MEIESSYDELPGDKATGPSVLIVDDDKLSRLTFRRRCEDEIRKHQLRLLECESIGQAIEILSTTEVHVVILDKKLGDDPKNSDHDGITSIPKLLAARPHAQVLVHSGFGGDQDIVRAMRNGAFGYVMKDCSDELLIEQLRAAIKAAMLSLRVMRAEAKSHCTQDDPVELPGKSGPIEGVRWQIGKMARSDVPVTLLGESGTGKTVIAKLGHKLRQQFLKQDGPFVSINMTAIPAQLAERELFGHEKGSFTGAIETKAGAVELANGGTLFLDEIGDAPWELQSKLLTVLDAGKYNRVGGPERKSFFRLICATNKDLEQLVQEGKFRDDLYYRISMFVIRVPALRERREDIPEIIRTVLPKCCRLTRVYVDFKDLPEDLIQYLTENPPTGNIRGVEQQIIQVLLHADVDKRGIPNLWQWKKFVSVPKGGTRETKRASNALRLEELLSRELDVVGHPKFPGMAKFMEAMTKRLIVDARRKYEKNGEVARALGMSQGVVSAKLKELGLSQRQIKKGQPSLMLGLTRSKSSQPSQEEASS